MNISKPETLRVALGDDDWTSAEGGWRCDALRLPGASFGGLYHNGSKVDDGDTRVENYIIYWTPRINRPQPQGTDGVVARIMLQGELFQLEEQKLQLEKDKFKWKIVTGIVAALGSIAGFFASNLTQESKQATATNPPPRIHTHTKVMSISEENCTNLVTKSLENRGLQDVTPVRKGVYAIQGNYNIFVGCDANTKSIVLVVSGSNDSEVKRIRADIIDLLPG